MYLLFAQFFGTRGVEAHALFRNLSHRGEMKHLNSYSTHFLHTLFSKKGTRKGGIHVLHTSCILVYAKPEAHH